MREKLKFGIDVDGVLRDIVSGILDIYNAEFNKNVTLDEFVHYDVNDQFPELSNAAEYFFSGENAKKLLCSSKSVEGSLNAFKLLKEIGTVYIVTSQHGYDNVRYTLDWLHNNGFDTDQICFVNDKSVITGLDYFIDDNPKKFIGCDSDNIVLINMPYNRYDMTDIINKSKCKAFMRHENLEAFTEFLINDLNGLNLFK